MVLAGRLDEVRQVHARIAVPTTRARHKILRIHPLEKGERRSGVHMYIRSMFSYLKGGSYSPYVPSNINASIAGV